MVDAVSSNSPPPMFSVVICTWNRGHLLQRALESLMRQTERSWEVVVVDDASKDETDVVLQKYEARIPAMVVVRNPHRTGTARARNVGIQASTGWYVTFLDSDDEYKPEHLALRQSFLTEHPETELLHGGVEVIGNPYVIDKDDPAKRIHVNDCVVGGTFVVRRGVFDRIGGFDEQLHYAEDTAFFERAQASGVRIEHITVPSYVYYRNVDGQITSAWTG